MSRTMSSSSRLRSSRFMSSRIRPQGRLSSTRYMRSTSIGSSEINSSLEARSFIKMPSDVSTSLHSNEAVLGLLKSNCTVLNTIKTKCVGKILSTDRLSSIHVLCLDKHAAQNGTTCVTSCLQFETQGG